MQTNNHYDARFRQFVELHQLGGPWIVAVSGGVDSMVLLSMASKLAKDGVIELKGVIHINHQTRPAENKKEQAMVENFCEKLGVKFFSQQLDGKITSTANENVLRDLRQKIYREYAEKYSCKIALAHHLDDSFEWHLMQQFKTSVATPKPIALFSKILVRPFHCFSKKQIYTIAKKFQVPFAQDSSQTNLRFERNFLREKVIGEIVNRYPNYLKNFVLRMNSLYIKKKSVQIIETKTSTILINEKFGDDWSGAREVIEAQVIRLSNKTRGRIGREIFQLIKNKNTRMKGPHRLSGGVEIIFFRGAAILFQRNSLEFSTGVQKIFSGQEMLNWRVGSENFLILLSEKDRLDLGISEFFPGIKLSENVVDYSTLRWFLGKKREFLLRKFSVQLISPF
jgi:tRNA(Ile)-lysidine synthase